jgi:hypothetical protein
MAQAVCDGHTVDWTALERQGTVEERAPVNALKNFVHLIGWRPTPLAPRHQSIDGTASLQWRIIPAIAALQSLVALANLGFSLTTGIVAFPAILQGCAVASLLACSAVLLWFGQDGRAVTLAHLLLLLAAATGQRFLHDVPQLILLALLARGVFPDAFLPFFAWNFVRDFPRVLRFSRLDVVCATAARLSAVVGATLFLTNIAITWFPSGLVPVIGIFSRGGTSVYWAVVFGLMAPALALMVARIPDADRTERRRVGLFLASLAAGLAPVILIVALELVSRTFDRLTDQYRYRVAADVLIYASLLSIPFTTTYSVIVYRVLDVSVVLRKTVRYALARQTLIATTIIPLVLFVRWVAVNRQLTVGELLGTRQAATTLTLAGAAVLLLSVRGRLLQMLDRRFFRLKVDLEDRLAAFTEALGGVRSQRQLADLLEATLQSSLQVEHAELFVRGENAFLPVRLAATPMPAMAAIPTLLDGMSDALDLVGSGLVDLLPAEDCAWVKRNQVSVLISITNHGALSGFIAVGQRRSGLDFPRESLRFLSTATAALSLAFARVRNVETESAAHVNRAESFEPAVECTSCGTVTLEGERHCACASPLRTAALPQVLGGKYRVDVVLGAGGMGVVYKGTDLVLRRAVALKTLPRVTRAAAESLDREAQSMARVAHPTLAAIHGVERWRGAPVLVMEFLARGTLALRIRRGPLDRNEAISLAERLVDCLFHLHRHALLHGDIKPSNVGFTETGHVKLLDFGLASVLDNLAQDTSTSYPSPSSRSAFRSGLRGTLLYLPPEAVDGAAPGPLFDLWAVALILYECLAGYHPFVRASTNSETLSSIRRARVPDVRTADPMCPPAIAAFLRDALARSPDRRPQTAEAFLARLTSAAAVGLRREPDVTTASRNRLSL